MRRFLSALLFLGVAASGVSVPVAPTPHAAELIDDSSLLGRLIAQVSKSLVKRDIPDPERCGCHSTKTSDPERRPADDAYLEYKNPYNRDKRNADESGYRSSENTSEMTSRSVEAEFRRNCSEENFTEEISNTEDSKMEKPVARKRRQLIGKNPSPESSFEGRKQTAKLSADYSVEDYAQGCEETEMDSDEANETTYDDSRRKREVFGIMSRRAAKKEKNYKKETETGTRAVKKKEMSGFYTDGVDSSEENIYEAATHAAILFGGHINSDNESQEDFEAELLKPSPGDKSFEPAESAEYDETKKYEVAKSDEERRQFDDKATTGAFGVRIEDVVIADPESKEAAADEERVAQRT